MSRHPREAVVNGENDGSSERASDGVVGNDVTDGSEDVVCLPGDE